MLACWDNTRYLCTMATGLRQRGAGLCAMRARTKHLLIGVLRVSTYLMPVASSRANTRTKECTVLAERCRPQHEVSLAAEPTNW